MLAPVVLTFGLVALVACDDDEPAGPSPDYTLTVSPTAVTVEADPPAAGPALVSAMGSADLTATISRTGGFTGAVTITVDGLPAGVTASGLTIESEETTGTVTLTASAAAAEGQSTLTVRGAATGVEPKEATVTLTVTSPPPAGSIALTLDPTQLSLEQGQSGDVAVTLQRTDFTGDISLAATSEPAGLEPTFDPEVVSGSASTLMVTAPAELAEGAYTLTVEATGEGVEAQMATVDVTVTAPSGTGNVTFGFCEETGIPAWLAYQDGEGDWTRATLTPPDTYSFDITSGTGAVAWVTTNGGSDLSVYYGSQEELELLGLSLCDGAGGATKTIMGTVAGIGNDQTGSISLGGDATTVAGGGTSFTLNAVPEGIVDLIAHRSSFATDGENFETVPDKVVIRRGLEPEDGSSLDLIDFGSSEAFDADQGTLTITNDLGHLLTAIVGFTTANGDTQGAFYSVVGAASRYFRVPNDQVVEGDLHSMFFSATELQDDEPVASRLLAQWLADPATEMTVALGPVLPAPTVTVEDSDPVVRVRTAVPAQTEYDRLWTVGYAQENGRVVAIQVLAGFGVGGALDITIPDLSAVDGWDDAWGLAPGAEISWNVTGVGFEGTGLEEPTLTDGATFRTATAFGTINP